VFPPAGAGQVFRPTAGGPDKSSAAVLSKERWERDGLPRWTTDGVIALPLAPSPYTAAIVQASCPHSHRCSSCAASPACSRQ
jgi:hypothetical protein